MIPEEVVIHLLDPEAISAESASAILNESERDRARRFRLESDGRRWSSFRAQLRIILAHVLNLPTSEVALIFSDLGKPLLAPPHDGLHFNLSHCADLGLVGLCLDGPIGVDVEPEDRDVDLPECETMFCHPLEIMELPENRAARAKRLLEIWTAKEAVLKALGTGLLHRPDSVRVLMNRGRGSASSETFIAGITHLQIQEIEDDRLVKYRAMLAAPHTVGIVRIL